MKGRVVSMTAAMWAAVVFVGLSVSLGAANSASADESDIPDHFESATESFDFVKRVVMIPMRDGIKLHTIVLLPKGLRRGPILLTRTPYGAAKATSVRDSPYLNAVLPAGDDVTSISGYIRVFQDVRGKYGSEGAYVLMRPLRGPYNSTDTDQSTDAFDTIDWLVKNIPECNGRVGIIGTSYAGFLALMAILDPHPALKVAVPIAPMVDVWRGDDWFHNGAFRQHYALDYAYWQTATRSSDQTLWRPGFDDYENFLEAGSAAAMGHLAGADQLPFWRRLIRHPAYDCYWQSQAVDRALADTKLRVPTMLVDGLWDQEDIYGAIAAYSALRRPGARDDLVHLVIGPWNHGQSNRRGSSLGPLRFDSDTSLYFRKSVLQPFLDSHLKSGVPDRNVPVLAFETGSNIWRQYSQWPPQQSPALHPEKITAYLSGEGALSWDASTSATSEFDEYVSDPSKPVPYRRRPIRPVYSDDSTWDDWLVDDQRDFATRPDVLVYTSSVLSSDLRVSGRAVARLYASTSGTDSDWVVKLIDVFPREVPSQPALGGYQLMISADILRGRYRNDPALPVPLTPNDVERYEIPLPAISHVFKAGHRVMIQIQSSWFPLYDRNPQTFVSNIFAARAGDYRKATQRIYRGGSFASSVVLPVLPQ